jgi:iron complex outermembrane receptor protein
LTRYDDKTSNAGTGKVSAVYSLPSSWTLHASVGTSFRAPMIYDLYQTWTAASGTIYNANADLAPEKMISAEGGIRKYIGTRFDADMSYYHNHITNLIYRAADYGVDPSGKWVINRNAGSENTDGYEFSTHYSPLSWLQVRLGYTYTEAVIASNPASLTSVGKRVTNIPKHMGSGSVMGSRGRFTASVTGRYVGSTYSSDANTDTTRGVCGSYCPYFVMDSSLGVRIDKHVQVFASVENMLDRYYFVYYLSPGRTANVGLRIRL